MKRVTRFATLALATLLAGALAYAQQQPPTQIPLGDLVKKQKAEKKAKMVVTDDDMPVRPPEAVAPAPAPGGAAGATAAPEAKDSQAPAAVEKPKNEQDRLAKIADLKDSEEAEKRVIKKMEDSLSDSSLSDNRRRMYEETLRLSRVQLDQFTKEREALEKAAANPSAQPGTPK